MQNIVDLNKKFKENPKDISLHLKEALQRIDMVEDSLNALITVSAASAIREAKASEERYINHAVRSSLDGTIASIKDVFCTNGMATTAASNMLDNFIPPYDATVVTKLKNAGTIIIGKNNCDAWAHGASTENSDFGVTPNPYDLAKVSGGSSGGSAAAVATMECDFSIGSDTGGSIRQPAGFCGVVGLKPTYGRVSRYGLIAMSSSLDCVGPIAKSTRDIASIMEIIAGVDPKDSTTVDVKVPKYSDFLGNSLVGKKIGWAKEFFEINLEQDIKKAIDEAKDQFVKLGAEFVEISLPNLKYSVPTYYLIQPAEVSSNLGRYDGIKYGYTASESDNLIDQYFKSRSEGLGSEAKRRIMLGTFVLSSGYYDAYYLKAMKVRTLIRQDFEKAFSKVDIIISPVSPTTAFKIGEKSADPIEMYLADVYTAGVNLAGNPSLSLPCGFDKNNMPIAMQLIGRYFEEDLVMNFGHQYELATSNFGWRNNKVSI